MKNSVFCVIFFIFGIYLTEAEVDVFGELKDCRSGPTVNQCIVDALNAIVPRLKGGSKDYNIEPLDPLFVPVIKYAQKSKGALQLVQEYYNTSIYKFASDSKFTKAKVDADKNSVEIEFVNPLIKFDGDYKLNGKILLIQVNSNGKYYVRFHNVHVKFYLKFEEYERDGHLYWRFNQVRTVIHPQKVTMHADDIIKGQKEISDQVNSLLNENWKDLWGEMKVIFGEAMSQIMDRVINRIFENIKIDETLKKM